MKDTTIFNIIVKSSVEENKQDNLQEVINIYNDYKEIEKELRNKMFDSPMYVGIGKWQVDKGYEIVDKFFSNIEVSGNQVISKYSVELPSSWDKNDVLEWVCGFREYSKILPMLKIDKISKNKEVELLNSYDDIVKMIADRVEYQIN